MTITNYGKLVSEHHGMLGDCLPLKLGPCEKSFRRSWAMVVGGTRHYDLTYYKFIFPVLRPEEQNEFLQATFWLSAELWAFCRSKGETSFPCLFLQSRLSVFLGHVPLLHFPIQQPGIFKSLPVSDQRFHPHVSYP